MFGASTPKAAALVQVRKESGSEPVFFGDSLPDLEAAREAAVSFVGVVFEHDGFGDVPVIKLKDFTSPDHVQNSIDAAIRSAV